LIQEIALSSFSLQLGACLSEDGRLITVEGQESGFVLFGPYIPFKVGLYTFQVDVWFPAYNTPRAAIEICGDGIVLASQHISTHCQTIRIQAYVSADCKLEIRLHSDKTPVHINRVAYSVGAHAGREMSAVAREQLRGDLVRLVNSDGALHLVQEWLDPWTFHKSLFSENCFQVLPADSLYQHERLLRQAGVMPAAIQTFFDRNNRALDADATSGLLLDGYPQVTNAFQHEIVDSGYLELVSPYDGSIIRSENSIPVPINQLLAVVYEFQGENPFVVGVSTGWAGVASFIWFVKHDIIVVYDTVGRFDWTSPESVVSAYLAFCVTHGEQLRDYRKTTHTVAIASGFNRNLGHYFWNEVSGLERLIRLTDMNRVQTVYSPKSNWLSIREIFASDQLRSVIELDDWKDLAGEVLARNQILVHPTGTRLDDRLAVKLKRAAELRFSAEAPERSQRAKELTSSGQYLLYVNLRSHNKAWIEQDEGVVAIIKTLRALCEGDIVVYLDGFADCEESARKISSVSVERLVYVTGIVGAGADFPETLYWAFRCDFFVAVIGSGLVPLTWIANRPGICHGDLEHLGQMDWWRSVRPGAAPLGWPPRAQVQNVKDRAYSNYSIDPADMVELFLQIWPKTNSFQ
jgi:hypothetical protein